MQQKCPGLNQGIFVVRHTYDERLDAFDILGLAESNASSNQQGKVENIS